MSAIYRRIRESRDALVNHLPAITDPIQRRDAQRDIERYDNELAELDILALNVGPSTRGAENRAAGAPYGHELPGRSAPFLTREHRFANWTERHVPSRNPGDRDVRLGAVLQAWLTGRRDHLNDAELRSMSEGISTAGGAFVPTPTAAAFIDRARNAARVVQAGATTVPMDSATLKVPRLTGSSAPAWRNELAAIAVGDLTVDAVTLTARSLSFIVKMSRELVEDSNPSMLDVVEADLAAQVALEIDRVALRGTGTPPEPRGVRNTSGVTVVAHGGVNGAAPTNYDHLLDAIQTVRAQNFEPNAIIQTPRSETSLAKLKEATTNAYMVPPASLATVPRLTTNQIPINLTAGTSSDTTEVYLGQWPLLYLGMRTGPLNITLAERYSDEGAIGLCVWFRGDVAVAQPSAFTVVAGVRP